MSLKEARPGQPLSTHLLGVAHKTADRLPPQWQTIGWYAGLWHDLGKILQEWQRYLNKQGKRVSHSGQGAMLARSMTHDDDVSALTFVIAAHHAGLGNESDYAGDDFENRAPDWEAARDQGIELMASLLPPERPDFLPATLPEFNGLKPTRREFAIRMLFGCLVDADRLDAAIFDPASDLSTDPWQPQAISNLPLDLNPPRPSESSNSLQALRQEFAEACLAAAQHDRGLFRLTGPTGIGKTLASLKFAIAHCQAQKLEGILYVGPLLSIIDQTHQDYSQLLNTLLPVKVLAHYSDFEPKPNEIKTYKLTAERWDAPVICTSGVQFFESLFANSASRCRKLSHLMNRCLLIDEAQTIPIEYAKPILDVLKTLVEDWGCSIVLMSATQPYFGNIDSDFNKKCIDIIPDSDRKIFFTATQRVTFQVANHPWSWQDITKYASQAPQQQSLTVVNTTKLAYQGFQNFTNSDTSGISPEHCFHLSARMTPYHRSRVLKQVINRLNLNQPCHVISTQVVEAGIDLDFPFIMRQFAPLDSIIQAAGRCNRNGNLLPSNAIAWIFNLENDNSYPSSDYKARTDITRSILESLDINQSLLEAIDIYYRKSYASGDGDKHKIQPLRNKFLFASVQEKFKLIEKDHQFSAFVQYEASSNLLANMNLELPLSEREWRSLQPHTVNLPLQWKTSIEHDYPCGLVIWPERYYDKNCGAIKPI